MSRQAIVLLVAAVLVVVGTSLVSLLHLSRAVVGTALGYVTLVFVVLSWPSERERKPYRQRHRWGWVAFITAGYASSTAPLFLEGTSQYVVSAVLVGLGFVGLWAGYRSPEASQA